MAPSWQGGPVLLDQAHPGCVCRMPSDAEMIGPIDNFAAPVVEMFNTAIGVINRQPSNGNWQALDVMPSSSLLLPGIFWPGGGWLQHVYPLAEGGTSGQGCAQNLSAKFLASGSRSAAESNHPTINSLDMNPKALPMPWQRSGTARARCNSKYGAVLSYLRHI